MSSVPGTMPAHDVRPELLQLPAWQLVAIAFVASLGMAWPMMAPVWSSGYFGDTDDALRMVQVRDLLAGQGWFDLTIYRLNPPDGLFNHWSRIVDLPLILLLKIFGLFLTPDHAERAARIVFPALMLLLLFMAVARAAQSMFGQEGIAPALLLVVLSGVSIGQFQPGRIDHHAPQIVLLAWTFAISVDALDSARLSKMAVAGALSAISLGISIENITFIVALISFCILLWAIRDDLQHRTAMRSYGIGLLTTLTVIFLVTVGPTRWSIASCDALSVSYLVPFALLAAGLVLFSFLSVASSATRIAMMLGLGSILAAVSAYVFPQCLQGPLSSVDPVLRSYWLDNVSEARNLIAALIANPQFTVLTVAPLFLCSVFATGAIWQSSGSSRLQWILLGTFLLAGVVTTIWQIRAGSSLGPLACLAGVWLILRLRRFFENRQLQTASLLALGAALFISPTGWAMLHGAAHAFVRPAAVVSNTSAVAQDVSVNCFQTDIYQRLGQLPQGLVAAPIDAGAHILALTDHSVLAAAYHRNNAGNRKVFDLFTADPDKASSLMRESGIRYIVFCKNAAEREVLKQLAPNGLGPQLFAGKVPLWLQRISPEHESLQIMELK
jgi:hypothetical protein